VLDNLAAAIRFAPEGKHDPLKPSFHFGIDFFDRYANETG
jgi:hypothetical protein